MDATTLLQHRDFMLRVARAMLRDEADVEDVVQESYVAALQSAPPRTGRVRPWLGGITRNLARNLKRSEGRRRAREQRVARPEGVEGTADRLRWQQRVVEAVLALDAPYRDVILLRFYEELPPREVAARLDLPVNTVRTQTRRAIEQLRGVFDRKYGGRAAWSAAIGSLFFAKAASASKLLVAVLLLAVTGVTGALWHSSRREESVPTRRDEAAAIDTRDESRSTEHPKTATESATRKRPTHYRGRIFPFGDGVDTPLAGATVHLQKFSDPWRHPVRYGWLATTTTDAEGRFSIPWKPDWKFDNDKDRSGFLLYVVHERRWSDPIYADPDGFAGGGGFVARVEMQDNPRFEFANGFGGSGIAGARVTLFEAPQPGTIELGPEMGSATTDSKGYARPEWPSWCSKAVIRVQRPNGDSLQWSMELQQARGYDPYDISLGADDVATVRMKVVERNGSPAAGVRVAVRGNWAPDGITGGPYVRVALGAERVPLVGVTDRDGVATFRFPADRARQGIYLPYRMTAYREQDGLPQLIEWIPDQSTEQEVLGARTGNTLPLLQFGVTGRRRGFFAVRSHDPFIELEVYWRRGDGGLRSLGVRREFRIDQFSFCRLVNGGLGPLRGRGEVGFITRNRDRIAWARLDEAQLASCLSGESVVEPCSVQPPMQFTLRVPEGHPANKVVLEAIGVPYVMGGGVLPGSEQTLVLPAIPGKWRIRFGRDLKQSVIFDPRKDSPFTLPLPRD